MISPGNPPGSTPGLTFTFGQLPPSESQMDLPATPESQATGASTSTTESANTTRDEQSSSIPGAENKEVKPPNPLDTSQSDDSDTVSLLEARSTFDEEFNSEEQRDDDLLNRIPTMYRLLDLLRERGSGGLGGLVEKVIIDQHSLGLLLNTLLPGSYKSVSRIDFKALDELTVKPKGVYGSKPEITKFLRSVNCIDENIAHRLSMPGDQNSSSTLHSGIYLALPLKQENQGDKVHDVYLIYWPEDTTWNDNASLDVQRNRVTFMRYLTQLSDQIVSLVSTEQAKSFVWDSSIRNVETQAVREGEDDDGDDDDERMFSFEVSKSEEQEENVTASEGFQVDIPQRMIARKDVGLVGGETAAGLLISWIEDPQTLTKEVDEGYTTMRLKGSLCTPYHVITLGDQIDYEQLRVLRDHGLRDKFPAPFKTYEQEVERVRRKRDHDLEVSKHNIQRSLEEETPEIERGIRAITKVITQDFWVYTEDTLTQVQTDNQPPSPENYPYLIELAKKSSSKSKMTSVRSDGFQTLKSAICMLRDQFDSKKLDKTEQLASIAAVKQELGSLPADAGPTDTKSASFLSNLKALFFGSSKDKNSPPKVKDLTDLEFLSSINQLVTTYPTLFDLGQLVIAKLKDYLVSREGQFVDQNLGKAIDRERRNRSDSLTNQLEQAYKSHIHLLRVQLLGELRQIMRSDQSCTSSVVINRIQLQKHIYSSRFADVMYRMNTTHIKSLPRRTLYRFYPLGLTQEAILQCQSDDAYTPQPVLSHKEEFEFALEDGYSLEFIQFVRGKCLAIVASGEQSRIFMNDYNDISRAILTGGDKVTLRRLGGKPIYAFDEGTRLLAVLHGQGDLKVTCYSFDENFSSLRNRGSLSLQGWYEQSADVQNICFIAGSEELCLIDTFGHARILSLVTEGFRPASLQIGHAIQVAGSSPDGSCLFVTAQISKTQATELLAYHWTSFGSNPKGFNPTRLAPGVTNYLVTSFESRSRTYLLSLSPPNSGTISSTALHVTRKSTEFAFKATDVIATATSIPTNNNCLIDCYMEMWTRFPVLPAIARNTLSASVRKPRSITFVSSGDFSGAKGYFTKMISEFEQTTQKPTDGKLSAIEVGWCLDVLDAFAAHTDGSYFHFGSFIVELLCLIPIHLAVTRENRFIPLKDGVLNPAYERKLLGADVPTIINSLSIGWYESLFQSYMASKPVRVVSSMGEQSVGKSYCLNHFADTSFAGSAMRTTEGVWLSCTPTDEYLLVSLDFEGVHSIERSAQEDALLVLFNAALSNIVLFRNNFAISRDIANLFTSFQSSAMVLDPQVNPGLFNSDLAIIIKDVIKTDSREIVREFSQKFHAIVREEQDQNFITRLHRGRVHIMPWPVITSPGFYTLFRGIRDRILDKQPITHQSGGIFLHTLKTLMAKIKANDWGSLDQNLAAHRAQQLAERLQAAICRGGVEQGQEIWGPLKDLDTDQELTYDRPLSNDIFWVPSITGELPDNNGVDIESSLNELIAAHQAALGARHNVQESVYFAILQAQIYAQLDQRLEQVRHWINTNTSRFPPENQDIRDLFNKVEAIALATRAAVKMCSSACFSCHLLCLRPYRHEGEHDCGTTHRCALLCEVSDEHPEPVPCGLRSGHGGRHLCGEGKHTCGQNCLLSDRSGCTHSCGKAIDHDGEHMCSARLHFCGKRCDLQNAKQPGMPYSCPGICQMPWDEPHERHACPAANACPMECQLCRHLCCSTDHFHGLDPDTVHLCGQEHNCTMLCEAPGICSIETQPSAILEQFTGRYETFEYTQYSQEKRRLSCVVPIRPGHIGHHGPHTHSTADVVFHFCDVQCPRCKYYCTLPLGHPQQEHNTSHGSMTETQWLIEGSDENPAYELQGRKYGTGDQGAPMLCSLVCTQQGRHAHVDYCRDPEGCGGPDHQHMTERLLPRPELPKDWISHGLYWARSGFKDPYARDEQIEFAKCDAYCADPKHEATATLPAAPSYCNLPIFHPRQNQRLGRGIGYISQDGHSFSCQNPVQPYQNHHIVFVIDSSGSMGFSDHRPLPNTPISARLRSTCDNRYGAVLSALYGFFRSRQTSATSARGVGSTRADAYSVITFASSVVTKISNNTSYTADQVINQLILQPTGGTNFTAALAQAQTLIETNWNADRTPVVIFLSDGEGQIEDRFVTNICQLCVRLGKPLSFYTVSFGSERSSQSLRQMANVAHRVYATAQQTNRGLPSKNPCSYANAIGSIDLATTFSAISNSLQKPRASLIGSSNNRVQAIA